MGLDSNVPLKRTFEKLGPEQRGIIAREYQRLSMVADKMCEMLKVFPLGTYNLEAALVTLGAATAQVNYIQRIRQRIKEFSGERHFIFPREFDELRKHCLEQSETCMKLVYAITYNAIKKEEATTV